MELYQCIESRKSFRAFIPKEIDKQILSRILEAANRSPSYMNTQPWEVFVVAGEKKDALIKLLLEQASAGAVPRPDLAYPKEWPETIERRLKEHRLRRLQALGIDPKDEAAIRASMLRNFEFYGAPCVLFVGMEKSLTPWSLFDLGLFTSSVLLAAQAVGLGCCPQAMPMAYPDLIRKELGISPTICLILAICMGYPDPRAKINEYLSARKRSNEFVTWSGFID